MLGAISFSTFVISSFELFHFTLRNCSINNPHIMMNIEFCFSVLLINLSSITSLLRIFLLYFSFLIFFVCFSLETTLFCFFIVQWYNLDFHLDYVLNISFVFCSLISLCTTIYDKEKKYVSMLLSTQVNYI